MDELALQRHYVEELPGSITVEREGVRWLLHLRGEIDRCVIDDFQRTYGARSVAVDVSNTGDVTFMGASGLSFMLRCRKDSTEVGRAAALSQPSRCVERLLGLVGLENTFQRIGDGK